MFNIYCNVGSNELRSYISTSVLVYIYCSVDSNRNCEYISTNSTYVKGNIMKFLKMLKDEYGIEIYIPVPSFTADQLVMFMAIWQYYFIPF